jgi:hypothetical protein
MPLGGRGEQTSRSSRTVAGERLHVFPLEKGVERVTLVLDGVDEHVGELAEPVDLLL